MVIYVLPLEKGRPSGMQKVHVQQPWVSILMIYPDSLWCGFMPEKFKEIDSNWRCHLTVLFRHESLLGFEFHCCYFSVENNQFTFISNNLIAAKQQIQ